MSHVNAAIAANQRKIDEGTKYLLLLLAAAVGPLVLLWLDRPRYYQVADAPGIRQIVATFFAVVGWVFTAILWLTVPLAGYAAWLVGMLSTARRVGGFSGAPVEVGDFIRTMRIPGWNAAWFAILGLPLASAIWSTVRIDLIPEWARTMGDNLAVVAILAGVVLSVISGTRLVRIFNENRDTQARLRDAVAAIIGVHPKAIDEGKASFSFDEEGSLVIFPPMAFVQDGVEARLHNTALSEQYMVASVNSSQIVLARITETERDRLAALRASGGAVQGVTALVAHEIDPDLPLVAIEGDFDDDPFGAMPIPTLTQPDTDDGVITLSEEAWS